MPYLTENHVTSYSDHDTQPEYATSADEDTASFNDARARAFTAAEDASAALDDLYGSRHRQDMAGAMFDLADAFEVLLARVRQVAR